VENNNVENQRLPLDEKIFIFVSVLAVIGFISYLHAYSVMKYYGFIFIFCLMVCIVLRGKFVIVKHNPWLPLLCYSFVSMIFLNRPASIFYFIMILVATLLFSHRLSVKAVCTIQKIFIVVGIVCASCVFLQPFFSTLFYQITDRIHLQSVANLIKFNAQYFVYNGIMGESSYTSIIIIIGLLFLVNTIPYCKRKILVIAISVVMYISIIILGKRNFILAVPVAILSVWLINEYRKNIEHPFDIIYWNRDGIKEYIKANNIFYLNYNLRAGDSIYKKIKGYFIFKKYAEKILKRNDYDGIILLQTIAGVLLRRVIKKYYCKKYILDIRDYTMERNWLFYRIEKDVIEHSAMTVISSEGYKKFLPAFDYILLHNNRELDVNVIKKIRERNKKRNKLVIAFIGFVNYLEQQKKLINTFKNDERFEIRFIGKNADKLKPYCIENKILNVKIEDQFSPENIMSYYSDVDIINNLYGNNTPTLDYALSNKLYFAAELMMPILVCEGTFMEEISLKYGFGYTFNLDDPDACDKLYIYYQNLDWERFQKNCDLFLNKVNEENKMFDEKVKKFLGG